jgi:hypothetical protein
MRYNWGWVVFKLGPLTRRRSQYVDASMYSEDSRTFWQIWVFVFKQWSNGASADIFHNFFWGETPLVSSVTTAVYSYYMTSTFCTSTELQWILSTQVVIDLQAVYPTNISMPLGDLTFCGNCKIRTRHSRCSTNITDGQFYRPWLWLLVYKCSPVGRNI